MTRIFTFVLGLILNNLIATAQVTEPVDIAKKLFGQDSVVDIAHYIVDEYQGQPNGQNIPPGAILDFQLLQQTQTTAVVAMNITDSSGHGLNTYLHFKKDTSWKMCAFRALAMTGLIEKLKEDLEKMTPAEIDKMIKKSQQEKRKEMNFITSKQDYDFQLGNAKLTLETDENLIKHFRRNQNIFDSLKNDALSDVSLRKNDDKSRIALLKKKEAQYHQLFISSISYGDYELGHHSLTFLIGGILDNTVGYLYVKEPKDVPVMSPDNIIMLKEIGNGWYIYKTT